MWGVVHISYIVFSRLHIVLAWQFLPLPSAFFFILLQINLTSRQPYRDTIIRSSLSELFLIMCRSTSGLSLWVWIDFLPNYWITMTVGLAYRKIRLSSSDRSVMSCRVLKKAVVWTPTESRKSWLGRCLFGCLMCAQQNFIYLMNHACEGIVFPWQPSPPP
jgi:hypothetical protein